MARSTHHGAPPEPNHHLPARSEAPKAVPREGQGRRGGAGAAPDATRRTGTRTTTALCPSPLPSAQRSLLSVPCPDTTVRPPIRCISPMCPPGTQTMATATELVFAEQLRHLHDLARNRCWTLSPADGPRFFLALPARDGTRFALAVDCEDYARLPPAWRWCNPDSHVLEQPPDTPKGSSYLHSSGRICAPWNRRAYQQVDPQGPHADWTLQNWQTNPKTGDCNTLAGMALRIYVELSSGRYTGRSG